MFDIGFTELLLVGVLGLIILGPERLPKAARTVGLLIGKIRRTMSGIQNEIEQEIRNQEIREKLKNPMTTFVEDIEKTVIGGSDPSDSDNTHKDTESNNKTVKMSGPAISSTTASPVTDQPSVQASPTQTTLAPSNPVAEPSDHTEKAAPTSAENKN